MMTETMTMWLASSEPVLLAASDSSDSATNFLWLLGPAAGIGFYALIFLRYRNVNQRHAYERETHCTVANLAAEDHRTGRVSDVENSRIRGANSGSPRSRLGGRSGWSEQ